MAVMPDERLVISLVNRIFTAADRKDWTTYRSLMLDRVHVDFAGIGPHHPGTADADDLTRNTRAALGPVSVTQHMLTNHIVDIDGDDARVAFYEQALHHHPALGQGQRHHTWTLFGRATRDAIRTDRGWRIQRAGLSVVHQTGNPSLLADVAGLATTTTAQRLPTLADMKETSSMSHSSDADDVLKVVHTYFAAADAGDWDAYRELHANRVSVNFGGINDDSSGDITADDMLRSARTLLGPVHLTQHMISSEIVTVDGDDATVTFYEQALHHHPALGDDPDINTWVLYGRGRHRLRRSGDDWKLVAADLVPIYATGNANLLADVAATGTSTHPRT